MNQSVFSTRQQRRGPLRLFLTTVVLLSAALTSNSVLANGTLTISGTPASSAKVGSPYSFTPTVKDSLTGRTLYFNIGYKPAWATFDGTTGRLSGTPTAKDVGKYSNVGITVNDKINAAVLTAFSITVQASGGTTPAPPTPPKSGITISGAPSSTATVGTAYSFTPSVTDSLTGRTLYFNIGYKPAWATFDSTTGKLSGTPKASDVGKYANIGITVNDKVNAAVLTAFSITVQASGSTTPPPATVKISGTPATSVTAGSAYRFQPSATDSAGRSISFSVQNKPTWATFSIASGLLSGTPASTQTGTYSNIVVSASDGQSSSALTPFSIAVSAAGATTGSATLYWVDPTHNTDGTPLTNFGGIRIYYGNSSSSLNHVVQIPGTSSTSYTLGNLTSGTWYFGATAYNTVGAESGLSQIGSKTIH